MSYISEIVGDYKQALHVVGIILIVFIFAGIMLNFEGCTDFDGATRALEANGFTQIEMTGWRPLSASQNDFYCTGFKAKSPNGTMVEGTVTKGLMFKGNTIRID